MRNQFVNAFIEAAKKDSRMMFLSGDLGFKALEPVRDFLGSRFVNAGVAEQNLVSVAAGLASKGFRPWIYSITPFITLRPYEQLRNDVCFHKLPVCVVGNGGGYGYGIMGSSHHALEDIGAMSLLPYMQVLVPTYSSDVVQAVELAAQSSGPVYLRLAKEVAGEGPTSKMAWRTLAQGNQAVVVTTGPVVGELLSLLSGFEPNTFEIISLSEFPIREVPDAVVNKIEACGRLVTMEEHYPTGGLGQSMSIQLLGKLKRPISYLALAARGYPSGKYGSQSWHLKESGLSGAPLKTSLEAFLETRNG
jgi:transketolase